MLSNVLRWVTPARDKSLSHVGGSQLQEALSRCVLGVAHSATLEYAHTVFRSPWSLRAPGLNLAQLQKVRELQRQLLAL